MKALLMSTTLLAACTANQLPGTSQDFGTQDLALSTVPLVHRSAPTTCPSSRPAYNCQVGTGGLPMMCNSDAQCSTGSNGRCVGNAHDGCSCSYDTCSTDADCPSGHLCDCRDLWHYGTNGPNVCQPSNCRVDADCGANGYCSPSLDPGCGLYLGVTGWFCHTAQDACVNDSDCAGLDGGFGPPFCAFHPEVGHWSCSTEQCAG